MSNKNMKMEDKMEDQKDNKVLRLNAFKIYTLQFSCCLSSSSQMWVKSIGTISYGRRRVVDIKLIYINALQRQPFVMRFLQTLIFSFQQTCISISPHPLHKISTWCEEEQRGSWQKCWTESLMSVCHGERPTVEEFSIVICWRFEGNKTHMFKKENESRLLEQEFWNSFNFPWRRFCRN